MSSVLRRSRILFNRHRESRLFLTNTEKEMEKPRNLQDFDSKKLKHFLHSFDTIVTDCDGVLWIGHDPIEGSLETLNKLKASGKKIVFVSNNASMKIEDYCEKFRKLGYPICADEIVIPSRVICWYLKNRGFDGKAFVLATKSFIEVLRAEGIAVVEPTTNFLVESYQGILAEFKKSPDVKAVIVDIDVNMNWGKLVRSIQYLKNSEVLYLVGAYDKMIPVAENLALLGNKLFVDLISNLSNREPVCCGKPSETMKDYVINKFGITDPGRCLFIGDSLENDMKFADLCGFEKLWVGSGIDTPESTTTTADSPVPDYYLPRLGVLLPLLEASSRSNTV